MSSTTRSPLAFDPSTVDLDGLLKRLSLANARRNWRTLPRARRGRTMVLP